MPFNTVRGNFTTSIGPTALSILKASSLNRDLGNRRTRTGLPRPEVTLLAPAVEIAVRVMRRASKAAGRARSRLESTVMARFAMCFRAEAGDISVMQRYFRAAPEDKIDKGDIPFRVDRDVLPLDCEGTGPISLDAPLLEQTVPRHGISNAITMIDGRELLAGNNFGPRRIVIGERIAGYRELLQGMRLGIGLGNRPDGVPTAIHKLTKGSGYIG